MSLAIHNIQKNDFEKVLRRKYPPFLASIMAEGISEEKYYEGILSEPFCYDKIVILDGMWYYPTKRINEAIYLQIKDFVQKESLDHTKKLLQEREEKLLSLAKEGDFEKFCTACSEYMPSLGLFWLGGNELVEIIRKKLLAHTTKEEADDLLYLLNLPLDDNYHNLVESDLAQTNDLQKHLEKFPWLLSRYGSDVKYTLEEAKTRKAYLVNNYFEKYDEEKKKTRAAIKRAKDILGEEAYIDGLQFLIFYRTQRTDVLNRSFWYMMPVFKKMAKERNISYVDFLLCTREEILLKTPEKEVLEERSMHNAIVLQRKKVFVCIGKEYQHIKNIFAEEVAEKNELKGQIACKGLVQGTVKIINSAKDLFKIKEGDVLVTNMTTPNYVSAMKIAVAFVTDEGSVTCHAAIISREMNKPCIINTKHATKVFKDGDLVEVDANTGVVRKI